MGSILYLLTRLLPCLSLGTVVAQDACVNNPCGINANCTDLPDPAGDNAAGRTCACLSGFIGNPEVACELICNQSGSLIMKKAEDPFAAPEGAISRYSLRLNKAPVNGEIVTVTVAANDSFTSVTSGSQIVFDASNFSTPADVLLSATDDNLIRDQTYSARLRMRSQSGDSCFDEFDPVTSQGIPALNVRLLVAETDVGKFF